VDGSAHKPIDRLIASVVLTLTLAASPALADKQYGPSVTASEIKIGQTHPYSGPVSALGTMGKTQLAYFEKDSRRLTRTVASITDSPMCARGVFTIADVMLTMRPKRR
jgi:hypothetical protein